MPEPGVNDRNFSHPTTKSLRDPVGNRPGGRRLRKPLRIPGEYAEFRLNDGRHLDEVLGPDFFGPDSGHVTGKQREELRVGNDAMARHRRDNPDRYTAPPAAPGMPAGENGSQFASLPFGSEESEPEDSGLGFPIAKPRPVDISNRAQGQDRARGFRMFELPLTVDGSVDKGVLVPGSVYRIPDSAGGGTGQWKGGAFYNFDRKADWRMRTVEGLDAYSGVSGRPTPEERQARTIRELDDSFMPPAYLEGERVAAFRQATGYGLTRGEGGFTLTDPSGHELLDLAEGDAAELARLWSPDIADRVTAIGLIWRKDLTPSEKRKLLKEAVAAEEPLTGRVLTDRREIAEHLAKFAASNLAGKRLNAFDAVAEAMARGASDEQIGELLGAFNAAMLPEVLGTERFVQDLLKDLAPGLGNVRSFRHLQNDIAEIEQAIVTGEWSDAAWASGMAVLDAVGIFPGGNMLKAGVKLGERGVVKAVPHLDGLLAERTIRRFKAQWLYPKGPVPGAKELFGEGALAGFSDAEIESLDGLVRNRFGIGGGEEYLWKLGERMDTSIDPRVDKQFSVDLPKGHNLPTETRIYDLRARYRSDIIAEKSALLGRLARWFVGAQQRMDSGKTMSTVFENKVGVNPKTAGEEAADIHFRNNPKAAEKRGFRDVDDLRMHVEDVPIAFVLEDLPKYLDEWVKKGKLSGDEKDLLLRAMKQMRSNGIMGLPIDKYATLLARIGAGAARRIDTAPDEDPMAISPFQA